MTKTGKNGKGNGRYLKTECVLWPTEEMKSLERELNAATARLKECRVRNVEADMSILEDLTQRLEEMWGMEMVRIKDMKALGVSEETTMNAERQITKRQQQMRDLKIQMREIQTLKLMNEMFDEMVASLHRQARNGNIKRGQGV